MTQQRRMRPRIWSLLGLVFAFLWAQASPAQVATQLHFNTRVTVVNMIPFQMSGESHQDSEPSLAVNPRNKAEIAASAFTPTPADDRARLVALLLRDDVRIGGAPDGVPPPGDEEVPAPIYVSENGGLNWRLNPIVPFGNSLTGTNDMTLAFSGAGVLYSGLLRGDSGFFGTICPQAEPPPLPEDQIFVPTPDCFPLRGPRMIVARATDFTSAEPMEVLIDREFIDQPHIAAATVAAGADRGRDRVFAGNNDLSRMPDLFPFLTDLSGQTATVARSLDARASPALFASFVVDSRITTGQDGSATRVAIHPDGTVYATFYRFVSDPGTGTIIVNVMIVRDDDWAEGPTPFRDLVDPASETFGNLVAPLRSLPLTAESQPDFGQERFVASDLAVAVDPRDSSTVYVAWADQPHGAEAVEYDLHLRRSSDRGRTWEDVLTVEDAKNPGLAVNSRGSVGFLYQALRRRDGEPRWVTHFQRSTSGAVWHDMILADTPALVPEYRFLPYLSDHGHVQAVGTDFYGVFAANNTPNPDNFPQGVVYQRLVGSDGQLLSLDLEPVEASIDPFFFTVEQPRLEVLAPVD